MEGCPPGLPVQQDGAARCPLSRQQERVLELVALGLATNAIARQMFLSPQAVNYHLTRMFARYGVTSRAGLVARAYHEGSLSVGAWPPAHACPEDCVTPKVDASPDSTQQVAGSDTERLG